MNRQLCIWVSCLLLVASSCSLSWAGVADQPGRKGYKFSESTPHLWLYWNCHPETENTMGLEGLVEVKGQSDSPVYDLSMGLIGFDAEGKAIGEEAISIERYKLDQGVPLRFEVSLPLKGGETEFGLRVYYRYIPIYGGAGPKASRIAYSMEFYNWTFRDICSSE